MLPTVEGLPAIVTVVQRVDPEPGPVVKLSLPLVQSFDWARSGGTSLSPISGTFRKPSVVA